MYPSSSSSSSHNSIPSSSGGGLTRYVSAPGSLLTTAVDSVISGAHRDFASPHHAPPHPHPQLQRPPPAPSPFGQYYFSADFGIDSWENANSIVFSAPPGKRAKNIDGDSYSFQPLETQFSLPQTTLEMATVEKLLQIPEDSVPCKIRAKRGCATHPRSIAERERRTRISGRLKKLQELVPNMDKQTSYSDMLDLAVQHIRTLQTQVQKLRQELDNCTCGCTQSS
ncbi:LOW QUALITY PROTEIN: transcription factor bHLH128 [Punica granatum]|uniref:LOW QUALITY PROTEIN: transcription factor bHLH128 n=1 Tax=Punica granatum TaxID=22663 RepID=A0A6P8EAX8_PUNGR|nr:LOW QUALITY PROTEIN: transcription factor bHLH128 [Punica granatum]